MLFTKCASGAAARNNIEWSVLLTIAASLGLGLALEKTGAAETLAGSVISLAGGSPFFSLVLVYFVTMCFTEIITNNAAAVLIFPIALATAQNLGVSFTPFAISIMMAASASFSTPIGYQTNLMVFGPGGYQFSDYLRVGIPLNLLMAVVTLSVASLLWPF